MRPVGKLMIIGGAVNKGSFAETDYDQNVEKNLNFFERGILRKIINESGFFNPSLKNSLKVRFAAYPDLLAMIDSWKTDDDLLKILQLYDKKVG